MSPGVRREIFGKPIVSLPIASNFNSGLRYTPRVIPICSIEDIQVRYPPIWSNGSYGNPLWFRILKLDWADFFPHVSLHKQSGFFRDYRFTPDDPDAFVATVQAPLGG